MEAFSGVTLKFFSYVMHEFFVLVQGEYRRESGRAETGRQAPGT